jgi:hypothetical protein
VTRAPETGGRSKERGYFLKKKKGSLFLYFDKTIVKTVELSLSQHGL